MLAEVASQCGVSIEYLHAKITAVLSKGRSGAPVVTCIMKMFDDYAVAENFVKALSQKLKEKALGEGAFNNRKVKDDAKHKATVGKFVPKLRKMIANPSKYKWEGLSFSVYQAYHVPAEEMFENLRKSVDKFSDIIPLSMGARPNPKSTEVVSTLNTNGIYVNSSRKVGAEPTSDVTTLWENFGAGEGASRLLAEGVDWFEGQMGVCRAIQKEGGVAYKLKPEDKPNKLLDSELIEVMEAMALMENEELAVDDESQEDTSLDPSFAACESAEGEDDFAGNEEIQLFEDEEEGEEEAERMDLD
jgi:hypothetical protein